MAELEDEPAFTLVHQRAGYLWHVGGMGEPSKKNSTGPGKEQDRRKDFMVTKNVTNDCFVGMLCTFLGNELVTWHLSGVLMTLMRSSQLGKYKEVLKYIFYIYMYIFYIYIHIHISSHLYT